jgi:8-oxo-dGTP pyrophosphatase MutT (NUDIX family)
VSEWDPVSASLPRLLRDAEQAFADYHPGENPLAAAPDQAAVAAALRPGPEGLEVLLMVRTERPGDRWSGQVSLPGGRAETGDADLLQTAMRETEEELGLDLARHGRPLGRLRSLQAMARGGPVGLRITPFVFAVTEPGPLRLSAEASAGFWLPLERVARGELAHRQRVERETGDLWLPAWRFEERVVWGLTHRILSDLLTILRQEPERTIRGGS